MPDLPPIRLGLAGLGLAGAFMIRAAERHPRFVLAAGMDPLPAPREAFARRFGAPVYADYGALCDDPAIEAVYIASPHRFHAIQAVEALERGKHVLVEKPLALTLADCDRVVDAAQRTGRTAVVGHTHAFDPNIRAIRALLDGGSLGAVRMILGFNYTNYVYRPHAAEEFDGEQGGGVAFNQLSHQLEIARSIAGAPLRSVRGRVGLLDAQRPAPGYCTAFLDFESGAAASLTYSGYDFFDSDEFHHWIAEGGTQKPAGGQGEMRRAAATRSAEAVLHQELAFGARPLPVEQPFLPHFGIWIVTCDRGDLRLSPTGLLLHGVDGTRAIDVEPGEGRPGQGDALDELWRAVRLGRPSRFDACWGRDTVAAVLAILRSSTVRQEQAISGPTPDDDALTEQ